MNTFSAYIMIAVLLCVGATSLSACKPAAQQTTAADAATQPAAVVSQETKLGAIKKLLEITGTTAIAEHVIAQSIDQYRQMYPQVPDAEWDKLRGNVSEQGLTERLSPLYDKHFTYDEIQEMLAFYETPLGRKLLGSMPELTKSTDQVSRQWGKELGNQIVDHLTKSGF